MANDVVAAAQTWLRENEGQMLEDLRGLLRIPSLEADALPNAPFGAENRRALDYMLDLSRRHGLAVTDIEGYCGYAEFGEGPKMIMSLGHLDVVPVGPGWSHDPFGAEIEDGYVYARGANDDKGPTMSSFYAALALRHAMPDLPCRVRLVFGCNEESGFACVHRYMETEEAPTFGVAPDGGWPLIHAEKGISDFIVHRDLIQGEMALVSIEGGSRPNIVIDDCCAQVRVADSAREEVAAKAAAYFDRNIQADWKGSDLHIHATGKAAHGSYPHGGDNAALRILRFLVSISPLSTLEQYEDLYDLGMLSGDGLGIAGSDEPSGQLTCNLGIVRTLGGVAEFTLNVRYPVTFRGEDLRAKTERKMAKLGAGWKLESMSDSKPLYFPLDHPMVRAIRSAHETETGEVKEPGVMGGGTYARAVPNTVAIGTGWLGDGPAHEIDERIKIEHLGKMARIYARVFYNLAELTR